jgi:hypothetical protein
MKNLFLIGLAIGAAYSAFDTMAITTKTMQSIDAQSFEREKCIQQYNDDADGEIIETCHELLNQKQ